VWCINSVILTLITVFCYPCSPLQRVNHSLWIWCSVLVAGPGGRRFFVKLQNHVRTIICFWSMCVSFKWRPCLRMRERVRTLEGKKKNVLCKPNQLTKTLPRHSTFSCNSMITTLVRPLLAKFMVTQIDRNFSILWK
jgi:hypothetical protein